MIFRPVPCVDGVVEPPGSRLEDDDRRPGPPRDLLESAAAVVKEEVAVEDRDEDVVADFDRERCVRRPPGERRRCACRRG